MPDKIFLTLFYAFLFLAAAAQQPPVEVKYKDYEINRSLQTDSSMNAFLQPYTDSIRKEMRTVIGFNNATWYKKQPESLLGNFMADCMKMYAEKIYGVPVDVSIVNYGGIRSYFPKGDIQIETLYELMPFDNTIVLQKINGTALHALFDLIAYKGGWPVSGVSMQIKDKTATDILINNQPLQDTAVYTIAVPDYLANGGDGCSLLKKLPQQNKNYLFREALIDYVKSFTTAGKPVMSHLQNRIRYAAE